MKSKKMLFALLAIVSVAVMTSFTLASTRQSIRDVFKANDPVGQTWITTEYYDGSTWYVLKATNTSGECFYLSGNIRITSTGAIVPVGKNIPASANRKERAVRVYALPQEFEKIEDSFSADDCIW